MRASLEVPAQERASVEAKRGERTVSWSTAVVERRKVEERCRRRMARQSCRLTVSPLRRVQAPLPPAASPSLPAQTLALERSNRGTVARTSSREGRIILVSSAAWFRAVKKVTHRMLLRHRSSLPLRLSRPSRSIRASTRILHLLPPIQFLPQLLRRLVLRIGRVEVGVCVPEDEELAVPALEDGELRVGRKAGRRNGCWEGVFLREREGELGNKEHEGKEEGAP